ncbi:hypothetical protein [Pseudomonas sp. Root329]|uniref:hypothetical protein n=1 Tax=Pseudomonas sp. Root329 TaxID=1736515 RepID=UPI000A627ACC|nr:hypothetical protein [Pseudomonas sp. Root329]
MFDEIPTHVLNDSAPQRVYPLGADPVYRSPLYNAANVCASQVRKQSLLSTGVPHE